MFWKKKTPVQTQESFSVSVIAPKVETTTDKLHRATHSLAAALNAYAEAAYLATQPQPDDELASAYDKVAAAQKLVTEGRLAYALGRCLPEHVEHWPSWSQREDFQKWVGFEATEIAAVASKELDGSRTVNVCKVDFSFRGSRYRLILRNFGLSMIPDDSCWLGEVELFKDVNRLARFGLTQDISKEYSHWQFSDVRALKVGPWMKDVLDMAAQIETSLSMQLDHFRDQEILAAAREIDFG